MENQININDFAYQLEDIIVVIHKYDDGYYFTILDYDYREINGGVYDNIDIDIHTASKDIVDYIKNNMDRNGVEGKISKDSKMLPLDYEKIVEKIKKK